MFDINDAAPFALQQYATDYDHHQRPCFPSSSSTEATLSTANLELAQPAPLRGAPDQDHEFDHCIQPGRAQLTIFYSGKVLVYDDVPEQKARALMLLATGQSLVNPTMVNPTTAASTHGTTPTSRRASTSMRAFHHGFSSVVLSRPRHQTYAELPFARKASLARFLKTRKGRKPSAKLT